MGLRESQRRHTIGLIVAAATDVFGQRGYHGTSMEDVAKATGCATATLYGYFPSKEALFTHVLGELITAYLDGVRTAVEATTTYEAGVRAYFAHFLDFAESRQAFLRVMLAVMRSAQPGTTPAAESADAFRAAYFALLSPVLARAVDEGRLPAVTDLEPLVGLLTGVLHTASYPWLLDATYDLRPAILSARALFLAGAPAAAAQLASGAPE